MNNPVAMPAHYGYVDDKGYDVCSHDEAEFFRKAREAAKLADLSAGQEDHGDTLSKKYIGCVERPNMEEIVSEAMKEVFSKHTEELAKKQVGGNHYKVAAIQPWDVMAAYGLDPWSANVLKYLLRFPYKAGRQDLEKAQHYIEYLITHYDEVNETYYNK